MEGVRQNSQKQILPLTFKGNLHHQPVVYSQSNGYCVPIVNVYAVLGGAVSFSEFKQFSDYIALTTTTEHA